MSDRLELTSEAKSVAVILFKLYGYPPPNNLSEFYSFKGLHFDQLKNALGSILPSTASNTFTYAAQDLLEMPIEQIYILDNIFKSSGITLENAQETIDEKTEPITLSHKTATPRYVKLLGKITPDMATRDPRTVLPAVFDQLVEDHSLGLDREQLTEIFIPLATKIIENDLDANSLHRITVEIFNQNGVSTDQAKELSDKLLIYHLSFPDKTDAQLRGYLRRLLGEDHATLNKVLADEIQNHEDTRTSDPATNKKGLTPLENELTAQFLTHGLNPQDARTAARQFINDGLAVSSSHLFTFIDSSNSREAIKAKQGLFSEALDNLSSKYPKLQGFKLNIDNYTQSFNSIPYFRELLSNPSSLLQVFNIPTISQFTNNLGLKYMTENFKNELLSKAISKFATTELGKKILTESVKKGLSLIAKEGLKKGLQVATSETIILPLLIELADKLLKPIKDLFSWAKRKVRENLPMVIGAAVALFTGLFTSIGIGGSLAAGAVAGITTSAVGGIGQIITGNPGSALLGASRTAGGLFTSLVTETAADSVAGIFFIILAIPILLALFLFIINTSAYVVPPPIDYFGGTPKCWPVKSPSICQDPCGIQCNGSNCTHSPNGLNPGGLNAFDLCDYQNGEPIYATHNGTVVAMVPEGVSEPTWGGGYGNYIVIKSDDGQFATLYGHMPYLGFVNIGQHVNTGTQIGVVDNTGYSFGPHLHYELRAQTSSFSTDVNLCSGQWGLNNFVPVGWGMGAPGTEYNGTCYANAQ